MLIFVLICIVADILAFDGYYRMAIVTEAKQLFHNFVALDWTGLFIPPNR